MAILQDVVLSWLDYTSPTRITMVATAVEPHTHSFTVDIGAVFKFPNHDHCLAVLQDVVLSWLDYTSPTRITMVATAVEPHTQSFTVDIGAALSSLTTTTV